MNKKPKLSINSLIFPSFILLCIIVVLFFIQDIWEFLKNPEQIKEWTLSWGVAGPLAIIIIQILQVIIFVIPGEFTQFASGYIFGAFLGFIYSNIGILIGSIFNFFLAKSFGTIFITSLIGQEKMQKFEILMTKKNSIAVFFALFLIPGGLKDILCYISGLSGMSFAWFLLISILGRAPGIFFSSIMGSAASEKNWIFVLIISLTAVAIFSVSMLLKDKIHKKIQKL